MLQKHLQANNVASGAQQSCGWGKARAACLDALADFYTAAVLQPQQVMPAQHDRVAADEVRSSKLVLAVKLSASFLGSCNMLRSHQSKGTGLNTPTMPPASSVLMMHTFLLQLIMDTILQLAATDQATKAPSMMQALSGGRAEV